MSKHSLRRWKILAQQRHEQLNPISPVEAQGDNSPCETTDDLTKRSERNSVEMDEEKRRRDSSLQGSEAGSVEMEGGKKFKFNEDLTCMHGKLSIALSPFSVSVFFNEPSLRSAQF